MNSTGKVHVVVQIKIPLTYKLYDLNLLKDNEIKISLQKVAQ